MLLHWPEVAGLRVLDLAAAATDTRDCWRIRMRRSHCSRPAAYPCCCKVPSGGRVCASMMQLPFAADTFDAVISGLALGHADGVYPWMVEIARVLRKGGTLLYSDFHPDAARAGLTRSFKDLDDRTRSVPHADLPWQLSLRPWGGGFSVEAVRRSPRRHRAACPCEFPRISYRHRCMALPIVLVVTGPEARASHLSTRSFATAVSAVYGFAERASRRWTRSRSLPTR